MGIDEAFERLYELAEERDEAGCVALAMEWPEIIARTSYVYGTFLHWAACENLPTVVDFAITNGIDVDTVNRDGETPLQKACDYSATSAAARLIEHGANPNHNLGKGPTPIIGAVIEGAKELVQLLIDHGADVNATYTLPSGKIVNPLSFAEDYDHEEIAALLRQHGAVLPDVAPGEPAPRTFRDDIVDFFTQQVGPVKKLGFHETLPLGNVAVSVHIIPPAQERAYLTLFTCGLSEEALVPPPGEGDGEFIELMLKLPPDWPMTREGLQQEPSRVAPVHWLRMCGHALHEHYTHLGPGVAIAAPKRIPEDWPFAAFLLTPAALPPIAAEGRSVRVYQVQPMYESEFTYAKEQGVKVFVELLQAAGVGDVYTASRATII